MGPLTFSFALGGAGQIVGRFRWGHFCGDDRFKGGARGNVALGGARENFGRFRWGRQHALFARRHVRGTAPLLVAAVFALITFITYDLSHSHTESAVSSTQSLFPGTPRFRTEPPRSSGTVFRPPARRRFSCRRLGTPSCLGGHQKLDMYHDRAPQLASSDIYMAPRPSQAALPARAAGRPQRTPMASIPDAGVTTTEAELVRRRMPELLGVASPRAARHGKRCLPAPLFCFPMVSSGRPRRTP